MILSIDRYFLAIVLPTPLHERAIEIKQYFMNHYQSKASLNSPPHITLHMPFEWGNGKEGALVDALQDLSSRLAPVYIELKDFNCFAPRVIFIQVIPSIELTALQYLVRQFCKKELGLFNVDYKDLPFHAHVTVAFRDLKKSKFAEAWTAFKDKKFEGKFLADKVSLLKFIEKKWEVINDFAMTG